MPENDVKKMFDVISILSESLGRKMSPESIAFYVEGIEDVPMEKFDAAVKTIRKEHRFMPSPAEFREIAVGMPLLPSVADVNAAWTKRWGTERV